MAHTKVTKTHSQNTGVANTFSYSGSFDVFKGSEVVATLDGTALTFTSTTINESASPREYTVDTSAKTIHIGGADLSSGTIIIRPQTDMGAPTPRANYTPGASITSEDLNNNQLQLMRKAMEYDETKMSSTGDSMSGHLTMEAAQTIIFEGATDDGYETTLTVTDPTADRTITLPNVTGTVVTTGDSQSVATGMIADDAVDNDKLANSIVSAISANTAKVTNATHTGDVTGDTTLTIANDAVTSAKIDDGTIVTGNISASAAIDFTKLEDLDSGKILVGNSSNKATEVSMSGDVAIDNAGATTIQADAVEIGMIGCEQTTITDSDSHLPTSGAVVDYVAAQLEPFGGFEIIANRTSFPNTVPATGVAISITDASGIVFDSTSTPDATNCTEVDGTAVTIQAAPDALQGKTIGAGVGMLVSYSGSGTNYTFHRLLAKDADVEQLSQDIQDFKARYRTDTNRTSDGDSSNHDGDLFFDQTANKMYVYDGAYDAGGSWGEVTSTGEFKILGVKDNGEAHNGAGPTFNGTNKDQYDLFEGTSNASITQAAQLIVVLNGVVQKPNDGPWSGSNEGFHLDGTNGIRFCDPPPSGSTLFVTKCGSAAAVPTPADNSVTAAKTDISIVQGDVIYGNGTDSWTRLPKGTAGQILKMNSGATAPEWATGATDSTKMPLAGGTFTGDVIFDNSTHAGDDLTWDESDKALEFDDDVKATFGDDADLTIRHNGSSSYIDNNTGHIFIRTNVDDDDGGNIYIQAKSGENSILCNDDSSVQLYYDGTKEFSTKNGGVKLWGHSEQVINALTSASSVTIDFSLANIHTITMGHNVTFPDPSNESVGQSGSIILTQPGSGGPYTADWSDAAWRFVGGAAPTLSTAANAVDRIDYLVIAAGNIHCVASLDVK